MISCFEMLKDNFSYICISKMLEKVNGKTITNLVAPPYSFFLPFISSGHLYLSFSLYLSSFLAFFLSFFPSLPLYISVFQSFCLSFYISVFLYFCLSIFLSFYISVFLYFFLSLFLSLYLSAFPSSHTLCLCMSVCLSFLSSGHW